MHVPHIHIGVKKLSEDVKLLQVRLKASAFDKIRELQKKTGATNSGEVVRNALTILSILEDQADESGAVTILGKDDKPIKLVLK